MIDLLERAIKNEYGVDVGSLQFRAKGWGGYSYIIDAKNGSRYFLKVQPLTGPEWASAPSSPRFYLPLLHQLYVQNLIRVPSLALTTGGGYSAAVDGYELVLYDFIDGEVVGFGRLPEPILAQLAEMVGKLHSATPRLRFEHEFRETYTLGVEHDLLRSLENLAQPETPVSLGVERLRENLPRIREPVLASLARFNALQAYARDLDKPQVICHTDLHGGNLMIDTSTSLSASESENLVLLDWENAMRAPPEHDLFFIAGEPEFWEVFLPRYEKEAGPVSPDPDLLGFYWYRRAIEDVAGFLTRILADEGDPEGDREDLEMLLENVAWMDRIDDDVARFRIRLLEA
jgi:Ser/Thr protein kinase RdoA (MazF antagonist)